MSVRLLHIIDDHKFIDYCKSTFEQEGWQNHYAAFPDIELSTLRQHFDLIFIHYLRRPYQVLFKQNLFDADKIVWVVWGADAFSLGAFFNRHLMPLTQQVRTKLAFQKSFSYGLKIYAKTLSPRLFDKQPMHAEVLEMMHQIKHMMVLMPADADEIKAAYNLSAKAYHINYVDPLLATQQSFQFAEGNYVLMGNSAEFTNNYLDALQVLDVSSLSSRKLLLPLSYGDSQHAEIVADFATKKFGEQAMPLRHFMPFDQYVALLMQCEIAIMPHIRQQGIGNIVKLLLQGCHVYFNQESSVYKFLQAKGFVVGTLQQLSTLRPLNADEKLHNQQLALYWFGKNRLQAEARKLVDLVISGASER